MKTKTVSRRAGSVNAEVNDFNREIELTRRNKALMKFLEARARQTETVSLEEAKTLLGLHSA